MHANPWRMRALMAALECYSNSRAVTSIEARLME